MPRPIAKNLRIKRIISIRELESTKTYALHVIINKSRSGVACTSPQATTGLAKEFAAEDKKQCQENLSLKQSQLLYWASA